MTGFAQVAFPEKADGSLSRRTGRWSARGSPPRRSPRPAYFHPRPSAVRRTTRRARASQPRADEPRPRSSVDEQAQAILELEGPYNPGLEIGRHSRGRGHDVRLGHRPAHLAGIRRSCRPRASPRFAALPLERVQELIDDATDGRFIGFFGEPGVNVLELNLVDLDGGKRDDDPLRRACSRARSSSRRSATPSTKLDPRAQIPQPGDLHRRAGQRHRHRRSS